MGKYIFDLNKIQEGDILLLNVNPRISAIMKQKTGSEYHHAMLYTGGSSHIHSDKGPGVQAENTVRMLFDAPEAAIALRMKDPEDFYFLSKIVDNARAKVGTEYSGDEAKRTVSDRNDEDFEPNRQFCTRFVAQAYAEGGLMIVKDPDYCSPFDLVNSEVLFVVSNILKEANAKEIAYAEEQNTVLSQQVDINNHILSNARKITGEDLQTFNQITEYLLANPAHDKEITGMIQKSGYLEIWEIDMKKNPGYYDYDVFIKDVKRKYWASATAQLAEVANDNMYRYKTNLFHYQQQYKIRQLAYIEMQIQLYEKLIDVTDQMITVAKRLENALGNNKRNLSH